MTAKEARKQSKASAAEIHQDILNAVEKAIKDASEAGMTIASVDLELPHSLYVLLEDYGYHMFQTKERTEIAW